MWVQYSPTEYMTYVAVSTAVLLYYCQYCTTQYCNSIATVLHNSVLQQYCTTQYCTTQEY